MNDRGAEQGDGKCDEEGFEDDPDVVPCVDVVDVECVVAGECFISVCEIAVLDHVRDDGGFALCQRGTGVCPSDGQLGFEEEV